MKLALSLLGVTLLVGIAPALRATVHSSDVTNVSRQKASADETFTGPIASNPDNRNMQDKFILYDQATMTNYFIEGNENLDRYVGKTVQVTGSLDEANHTIHPDSIQEVNATK